MFRYYVYGLHVESEIEVPELYVDTTDASAEIKISLGGFPEDAAPYHEGKTDDDYVCITGQATMLFRIPGVGDYSVYPDHIDVRPIADITSQPVKTYLLGSAFGYCMLLRNRLVLHGGGVSSNGKGIVVTGESGAGKSTVTTALRKKGYSFIADDVCSLSEGEAGMHINMAYPQQKLCRDAAIDLGYDLSELIYINEERDKFAVRLKDNYLPEGKSFDLLFEIVLSDTDELTFRKVTGHEALMLVMRNIYRGEGAFEHWGMPTNYMKQCLSVAGKVAIYQIARPKGRNTLDEIVNFIEEKVNGGVD